MTRSEYKSIMSQDSVFGYFPQKMWPIENIANTMLLATQSTRLAINPVMKKKLAIRGSARLC